ncbi:glutathionylspermidine synthase family protein [Paenibacillus methanolicus]|uniref:Glutathionylspermidine synthase n=1 Tax=Paenibacillus methanolicus TaxID=582686 RepID=A0A5S5C1W7_9BACL|nr:glutathionylspermidine synthase family protein [Paenibacillus methanolicus]TYP71953.1 glutathionylspermidine synthase [Paenibacillus methanolicus]
MRHDVRRSRFYERIDRYWADLYGEEYSLFDVHIVKHEEIEAIREATARVGRIYRKIGDLLQSVDEQTLLDLGFPVSSVPYLQAAGSSLPVIARLDLVPEGGTYRVLEINADTPTFIKELYRVNGLVCEQFGVQDPNAGLEAQLAEAVKRRIFDAWEALGREGFPAIAFTAHEDNVEDANTALYLQELSGLPSRFVPLHKLQIVQGEGLFDEEGMRIDILYRQTYPIEQMIEDTDAEGRPVGLWLLELAIEGKLAILNPLSAFMLQAKSVQAAIWGLHEEGSAYFTAEEHGWIRDHFLPTYLEPDPFLDRMERYVMKPSFGREGNSVKIFDGAGKLELADPQASYAHYLPVYQRCLDMPAVSFQTVQGAREGSYMIGSFLIDGMPGAIGLRAGNTITDNLSYFLPVGLEKK